MFEILFVLPDSVFGSWEWKAKDRRDWVDDIRTTGVVADSSAMEFSIKEIMPHYLDYQVVDGTWKLAVYKLNGRERIIFTDDITQGNDIDAFFCDGKQLEARGSFVSALLNEVLLMDATKECEEKLAEDFPFFDYDFSLQRQLVVLMRVTTKPRNRCAFKEIR